MNYYCNSTVWKVQEFSVIKILHEILAFEGQNQKNKQNSYPLKLNFGSNQTSRFSKIDFT